MPSEPTATAPANAAGRARPVGLAVAVMAVAAAVALRAATLSFPLFDLDVYLAGARAVSGGGDPYAVEVRGLLFTYPPFAAVAFLPLSLVANPAAVLTVVSLVAYLTIVTVVARRVRLAAVPTALVGLGGLALEPVARTLALGQVNLVLVALVVVDVLLLPRPFQGVLVGLAAGIKLIPAFFVVYFLVRRDWAAAIRAALVGVSTAAVGYLVAPDASRYYWSGRAFALESFGAYQSQPANQSLRGVTVRTLGTVDVPVLLYATVAVLVAGATVLVAIRRSRSGDDLGALVAVAVGSLLVSPISWTHHWVWVVPALIYAFSLGHRWAVWGVAVLFFTAPMWYLPTGGGEELRYTWWQTAVSAGYTVVGLAFLAFSGRSARCGRSAG